MKKLFSWLLVFVFLFSLAPFSAFAEAAETEAPEEAEPALTETEEAPEAESLPFAEEHGFVFPKELEAVKVPFQATFSTSHLEQVNPVILVSLPTVTVETGEDGLKTTVIEYSYKGLLQIQVKDSEGEPEDDAENWGYSIGVNDFELYDYGTGRRLIPEDVVTTVGEKSVSTGELVIPSPDGDVPITVTTEYISQDEDVVYEEELLSILMRFDLCYTVTSPADYDGLLLGTDTAVSYYEEGRELGETWDDENVENWLFYRVEDLIAEEPAEETETPAEEPAEEAETPAEESPEETAPVEAEEDEPAGDETPDTVSGDIPFAQQEEFLFPEDVEEVEVPFVAAFSEEGVEQLSPVITIPVPTVECSEPDEEGFVDWTITSEYSGELTAKLPDGVDLAELLYVGFVNDFELFDYYTGTRLQVEPNSSSNGSVSVATDETVLSWSGKEFPVSMKCEYCVLSERPVVEDGVLSWDKDFRIVFTVHAPADYHGLVLGVDTAEPLMDLSEFRFETDDLETGSERVWDYDDVENWVFFLVSDLLAEPVN
ncbi:MAG: hypothetical protein IJQ02_01140 [Oscillospiraceae bacterium]|nr:hypothetical protein [Oscillospiraceae bacterium]